MASTPRAHACDRVLSMALYPWAITAPMLSVVANILGHRLAGDALDTSQLEKRAPAALTIVGARGPLINDAPQANAVAVLPIHGVLAPRMNALSDISGGATYEEASLALRDIMAKPEVGTIVLDIDSPGGSVLGASEFARELLKARATKKIIAQAHYEMCSAAYWIGACATEVVAAPSAMVGSIGVYSLHEDLSKALEQMGVKLTYIAAGKFKVDGNEAEPLSDSARKRLQGLVDAHYARFVGDVAKGRGVVESDVRGGFGEGTSLTADEAVAAGLVDRIGTLEETVARVLPSSTGVAVAIAATPDVRDTPQELTRATGQDRTARLRAAQRELMLLGS
jgi:signal peptide peptidase SppA